MAYHNCCSHDHPTFPNLPLRPEIQVLQKRFVRSQFSPLVGPCCALIIPGRWILGQDLESDTYISLGRECVANHPRTLHHQNDTLVITGAFQNLLGFCWGLHIQRFLGKRGSSWNAKIWHIPEMHEPRSKISSPCSWDKNTTWRLKIDLLWAGEGLPEDEGSFRSPKKNMWSSKPWWAASTQSHQSDFFEGRFPKTNPDWPKCLVFGLVKDFFICPPWMMQH